MGKQRYPINIVSGVPGTGKTSTVNACLDATIPFVALDIDWLLDSANGLISIDNNIDIRFASRTWPAYNALWLEVMSTHLRNGNIPVLFAPLTPVDISQLPDWCESINWLYLDCPDEELVRRLQLRKWSTTAIQGVLGDAERLRVLANTEAHPTMMDTNKLSTADLVKAISQWVTGNTTCPP